MEILYDPISDVNLEDRYVNKYRKNQSFLFDKPDHSWKKNLNNFGCLNCSYCFVRFSYSNFAVICQHAKTSQEKVQGFVVEQVYDQLLINMANPRITDSDIEWYKALANIQTTVESLPEKKLKKRKNQSSEKSYKPRKGIEIEELDLQQVKSQTDQPEILFDVDCKNCLRTVGVFYFEKKVYFLTGAIEGIH